MVERLSPSRTEMSTVPKLVFPSLTLLAAFRAMPSPNLKTGRSLRFNRARRGLRNQVRLVQVDDHTRAVGVVGQGAREVLEVLQGDVLVQGVADGVLERVQLLRGARTAGSNRT